MHKDRRAWPNVVSQMIGKCLPVILAQEPYTITRAKHRIPNIHKDLMAYYHKSDVRCRASIHIHNMLKNKVWELNQFTCRDLIAVKIRTEQNKELILASAYMDCTEICPLNSIKPLVDFAKQQNLPLIIGSDVNARHFLWGNIESNKRGEDLLDFMVNHDLMWANQGSTPTFDNNRWQAIIDLTIMNKGAEGLINHWHVSEDISLSDHKFIFYEVKYLIKVAEPKRISKNTNWEEYCAVLSLDENLKRIADNPPTTTEQLDKAADILQQSMTKAIEKSCPITYIPNSIKDPPWLTREIKEAKRYTRKKLMKARTTKLDSDWRDYRKHAADYKKELNKSKTKEWRKFCAEAESIHEKARITKVIKTDYNKPNEIQSIYKLDGTITKTPTETLDRLTEVHFGSQTQSYQSNESNNHSVNGLGSRKLDQIYSSDRMRRAIRLFEANKAPGLDGIQPIHVQKGWDHISEPIQTIMKNSHLLGYVPKCWRESKGIFLSKPGKSDYLQPKAYRVITLTPTLLKLQERVILWHMQEDLKMGAILSNRQYGFKRGNSTVTALHKAVHRI